MICSAFLIIGEVKARAVSWHMAFEWREYCYESYVAASVLLYCTVLCTIFISVKGVKQRDIAGMLLIPCFMLILWFYDISFMDKIKGYVIWPMSR